MPGLSEHDLPRIAHLVKSLLQQEISEQVRTKVDDATKSLQTQLDDTKSELSDTKSALDDMRNQYDELQDKVLNIQIKQDEAEQYSRRMCLRVSGLPEAEHEDVTNVVLDFAKSLNSTIFPADIDRAHRVGAELQPLNEKL